MWDMDAATHRGDEHARWECGERRGAYVLAPGCWGWRAAYRNRTLLYMRARWEKLPREMELRGKDARIGGGWGALDRRVAWRARALETEMMVMDPYVTPAARELEVELISFEGSG